MTGTAELERERQQAALIEQLAELDRFESAGHAGHERCQDSGAWRLKQELDSVARKLCWPPPHDRFQDELAFWQALSWVEAIPGRVASPAPKPAPPSQELGSLGHYRLLSILGQGAMGTVYRALHTKLDKVVAIKILRSERLRDERAVARFEREMRAVARADHPHIVGASDAGECQGKHFLVMEFIPGVDLARLLRHVGPLAWPDACELIRQAASGLQDVHAKGMVHRDLKPSNLMLAPREDGSPLVKILDLGLARIDADQPPGERELTDTGRVMGTLAYMAPEQAANSHDVDIRADIYSLGVTLYKLLCGQMPFSAPRGGVSPGNAAPPAERGPAIVQRRNDLPAGLPAILDRMLAWHPDDRYATPAEVVAALAPFCDACDLAALLHRAASEPASSCPPAPLPATVDGLGSLTAEREESQPAGQPPQRSRLAGARRLRSSARRWPGILLAALAGLSSLGGVAWLLHATPDREPPAVATHAPASRPTIPELRLLEPPALAAAPFDADTALAHQQAWAWYLGNEIEIRNSIGMRFRLIPPGEFMMGSFPDEPKYAEHQGPRHRVRITRPFYLGVFPVTQGEYTEVMGINPSGYGAADPATGVIGSGVFTTRHPVNCVSWLRAVAFCNKLSEREGLRPCYAIDEASVVLLEGNGYRLPTEAEWEYSCRAGSVGMYCCWDNSQVDQYATYQANSPGLQPVGTKLANGFGLHDVHGMVSEWCNDWWSADYYANSPVDDPTGPESGTLRVMRGGSWRNTFPPNFRAAHRSRYKPDEHFDYFGFRVARMLPGELPSPQPAAALGQVDDT